MGLARTRWRVALLIEILLLYSRSSMADPRTELAGQFCNTSAAVSGDTLAINFVPAMANLSAGVEERGYATAMVGDAPNAVYGLAQCFKDLGTIDCRLCFSEIRSLLPRCYPKTGGTIFLDGCFGRYENFSFVDQITDPDDTTVCSPTNRSSEAARFGEAVRDATRNVSLEAQRNNGFAVGGAPTSSPGFNVYVLAQCWETLDRQLCNSCLNSAASSIVSCVPASEGRALKAGCYMRYSTRVFWNLDQNNPSSGKSKNLGIILGTTIGGSFVIILVLGVILWKRNWFGKITNRRASSDLFKSELALGTCGSANSTIPYNQLKMATGNFALSRKIGEGSYGTVYKGTFSDGREVAIKRLFLNPTQWRELFVNEVDLINRVRHKNLVKLLGCSVDGPESMLVYEYFVNKSLDQFIFDSRKAKLLDWEKRLSILQGVAEGLFYLHEESEIRIIHRDIKASNILLDERFKPKITDFGLARAFGQDLTHLSTGVAGTVGYMAPEYIVHGHLTEKVDVYSFGILVLEVITGKRCTSGTGNRAAQNFLARIWSHYKAGTGEKLIDESYYDEKVKDGILQVFHVGLLCIQAMASCRPKMGKVVELLRSNKEEEVVFPSEPPFLDVIGMEDFVEDDVSHLLSISPGLKFSDSSSSQFGGR